MADSNRDKPVLIMIEGPLRGQQWVMQGESLTLGRGGDCDIVIPEQKISRVHLRIRKQATKYLLEDMNSKNGTFLNGKLLESPMMLREGDEIQIALSVKLKFTGAEATVPMTIDEMEGLSDGGLQIDPRTHEVRYKDVVLDPPLSIYQYRLLELLYLRQGSICTREEVIQVVWPDAEQEGISEQAIDALVRRLRDRLIELPTQHQFIATIRGHGFRLVLPDKT
jgi:DNA-binding response OmpR family regulator